MLGALSTLVATTLSLALGLLASLLPRLPLDANWKLLLAALPLIALGTLTGRYLAAHPELG